MDQLPNMMYLASIWVIPVIIAITFHEAAHGYVARLLGDDTAWKLGRVSLNPVKHIDPCYSHDFGRGVVCCLNAGAEDHRC